MIIIVTSMFSRLSKPEGICTSEDKTKQCKDTHNSFCFVAFSLNRKSLWAEKSPSCSREICTDCLEKIGGSKTTASEVNVTEAENVCLCLRVITKSFPCSLKNECKVWMKIKDDLLSPPDEEKGAVLLRTSFCHTFADPFDKLVNNSHETLFVYPNSQRDK